MAPPRSHLLTAVLCFVAPPLCLAQGDQDQLRQTIASVEPSVVTIEVPGVSVGSGFVVKADGIIATNYHVIEGAKEARVKLRDGSSFAVDGFLALSPGHDLALLSIKSPNKLPALPLSAASPSKGDTVLAFGAPIGLEGSVTTGIVSAVRTGIELNKLLGDDFYVKTLEYALDANWVQTTAPISHGNSGGPLVTTKGEVCGINTWYEPRGQNLNFALSSRHLQELLDGAEGKLHPLDELPKPRANAIVANGDADKTLAFWKQVAKARALLQRSTYGVGRPRHKYERQLFDDEKAQIDDLMAGRTPRVAFGAVRAVQTRHWATAWDEYAKTLRLLETAEVDADLAVLAILDAQSADRTAEALGLLSRELNAGRANSVVQLSQGLLVGLNLTKTDRSIINSRYDFLRFNLSTKYALQFPLIVEHEAEEAKAPARAVAAPAPKNRRDLESEAQSKLDLAELLLQAKKVQAARERLTKIVDDYPGTTAAERAKKLLNDAGAPLRAAKPNDE